MKKKNRINKAFHEAFSLISINTRKFKLFLRDKRITHAEKTILKCHLALRDNNYKELWSLLENCTPNNDYIKGHKNLVKAIALNNVGCFSKAIKLFEKTSYKFEAGVDDKFIFLLNVNAFICSSNMHDTKRMSKYLQLSLAHTENSNREMFIKEFIKFSFYHSIEDIQAAKEILIKIEEREHQLSSSEYNTFLISYFQFFILIDDTEHAYKILKKMKNSKKYYLTENYIFMSSLLDFLTKSKPIYLREEDLQRTKNLFYQVETIKSLYQGDLENANRYWTKLQKHNPYIYKDNFIFTGKKCLFSLCLARSLDMSKEFELNINQSWTNLEKLKYIFDNTEGTISKEKIFSLVWNKEAVDKTDILKVSKLISKYKKQLNFEIKNMHGSYMIKKKAS